MQNRKRCASPQDATFMLKVNSLCLQCASHFSEFLYDLANSLLLFADKSVCVIQMIRNHSDLLATHVGLYSAAPYTY